MEKKKTLLGLIAAIAIIVIGICVWYFQVKKPHDLAEAKFNAAVKEVEAKNTELTSAMNRKYWTKRKQFMITLLKKPLLLLFPMQKQHSAKYQIYQKRQQTSMLKRKSFLNHWITPL